MGRRSLAVESQLLSELLRSKLVGASRFGRHVPFAKVYNTTQYKTFISNRKATVPREDFTAGH